jgi:hypothetical protein
MKRWSIGDTYDRPIPRRMLEEAGVDRHKFGIIKKGAGTSFSMDTLSRLKYKMSSSSYKSLIMYNKSFPKNLYKDASYKFEFYRTNFPVYANYLMNKLGIKSRISYNSPRIGMLANPSATMMLSWAIETIKDRYKH